MKDCKSQVCQNINKRKSRKSFSWLPAIVIAILPKCPFCIMAYSGAISMCSGSTMYPNAGGIAAYVTIGLALVVLLSVALNYKGRKTQIAIFITLLGTLSLVLGQFFVVGQLIYYLGVTLLFFGIWYNGSFQYFYRRYFSKLIKSLSHS